MRGDHRRDHRRSENDPRRWRHLTLEQREERRKILRQLYNALDDRRHLERDLDELDTESMPKIAARYRQQIARLTARIHRFDEQLAAIEQRDEQRGQTPTTTATEETHLS